VISCFQNYLNILNDKCLIYTNGKGKQTFIFLEAG